MLDSEIKPILDAKVCPNLAGKDLSQANTVSGNFDKISISVGPVSFQNPKRLLHRCRWWTQSAVRAAWIGTCMGKVSLGRLEDVAGETDALILTWFKWRVRPSVGELKKVREQTQ